MVEPNKPRASGKSASQEEADRISKELDKTTNEVEVIEQPISLARSFQKLRTDWNSKDREVIQQVQSDVDQFIFAKFEDAFRIEYEIWDIVRAKKYDSNGEVLTDEFDLAIWDRRSDGSYIENWSNIGTKERERLLYEIITRLFTWEQTAAEIRGEALFAKAVWEEAFATAFDNADPGKKTVEARNAVGTVKSMDHRYLAVYKAVASDKAQAICRSMERLAQRIKDLHT